jgi:hypothetical protein
LDRDGVRVSGPSAGNGFEQDALLAASQRLASGAPVAGQLELTDYDSYYYRARHQSALDRPLPVLRVDLGDPNATRVYLDPADGRLLLKIDASRRAYRWLFTALHHWDFGWLAYAPVWRLWMLTWISLGLTLAVSGVVLAWRRLRITGQSMAARRAARIPEKSEAVRT